MASFFGRLTPPPPPLSALSLRRSVKRRQCRVYIYALKYALAHWTPVIRFCAFRVKVLNAGLNFSYPRCAGIAKTTNLDGGYSQEARGAATRGGRYAGDATHSSSTAPPLSTRRLAVCTLISNMTPVNKIVVHLSCTSVQTILEVVAKLE